MPYLNFQTVESTLISTLNKDVIWSSTSLRYALCICKETLQKCSNFTISFWRQPRLTLTSPTGCCFLSDQLIMNRLMRRRKRRSRDLQRSFWEISKKLVSILNSYFIWVNLKISFHTFRDLDLTNSIHLWFVTIPTISIKKMKTWGPCLQQ